MRPVIRQLTIQGVQEAINQLAAEVTRLQRRGENDLWRPASFALPDRDMVKNPSADTLAWDREAAGIVRWNGDEWEHVT